MGTYPVRSKRSILIKRLLQTYQKLVCRLLAPYPQKAASPHLEVIKAQKIKDIVCAALDAQYLTLAVSIGAVLLQKLTNSINRTAQNH